MDIIIDQRFLNKVIIILVAGMLLTGALLGLRMAGILGSDTRQSQSQEYTNGTPGYTGDRLQSEGSLPPDRGEPDSRNPVFATNGSDQKQQVVHWTYKNESFAYTQMVYNSTYASFKLKSATGSGRMTNTTVAGDRLQRYIVTDSDDGLTRGIAGYLLSESEKRGWGDYDTIANLVTFLQEYNTAGAFQNQPPPDSYNFPYETFYEGTGSRDDVTIFGGSVLKAMGYPVALLIYPQQYDRGYFIYSYEGIAIRSDESVQGVKYTTENATRIGSLTCLSDTRQYRIPGGGTFHPTEGFFRGNTTIYYAGNQSVPAGTAEWDIRSGTMSFADGFYPPAIRAPDHFVMENASWIDQDCFLYIDTANPGVLPGTIPGELSKVSPTIVTTLIKDANRIRIYRDDRMDATLQPSLRSPSPLTRSGNTTGPEFERSITDDLRIPVPSGEIDDILPENQQQENQYWQDVWYDRSTWYYDQNWYLDVLNYSVVENPYLYTRQNEIYIAPASAWRIKFRAIPTNPPDQDVPELSSFSDLRFAVYKIDKESNTASLFDTFSYGYSTGQESLKYRNYYEPGMFYIAVFVRNCMADVSIQMHGKDPVQGGSA
jgi:hypothetical protein